ncbi:ABC transporter substrate-binding protein [Lederbergia galactosidilytica]|uniref:Sugar ABC transporter substrate-binding protein n=1 Tax=Lederbergia galactosidilytica TaxID=217031 RepID=A0A177ZTY2_9BACI|nr:ABC transporter substrate-binding protein [Lederbergia galactosidilytica]MBP1915908.1 raffinose/stachyose/melibiose transport system substrate-binding protein [Lederbergia galactosidilytica]OAK71355.1 sugar ABC transporter substrate-binding protein [Lederbergia galactosidilytica]
MKGKKVLSKVVATLAVSGLLLAGCSSGDEGGAKKESSKDKVTIDIFQGKVEFNKQFKDLAKKYEEENPDVKINITSVGGGTDYISSLKSQFSSGDEPDIFSIAGPSEAAQFEGNLSDLSDTKAAKAALEGTLDAVTKDGKVQGLPFNQEGYGFIYNKTVFEKAGVNADEILTYDDLEKAVKTIDSKKDELEIEAVFALPAKEKWVLGNHLANVYFAPEFDHQVLNAYESDTVKFDRGSEMQRMLDLENKYSVQPSLSLDYSQQVEEYFSLEQVAMIQQGNWIYPSVSEMDSDFAENNIGILPIPVEGYEGSLPVGIPNYWAVNSNSDDETVEASKDFLDWLYTSDEGKESVLNDFKFIPAYEGFDTDKISDPLSKEIYQYASDGKTIGWVFLGYPDGWGDELGADMQKYLDGKLSWEDVEADSTKKWESKRK